MAGVFGQSSSPFGSSSTVGNTINSNHNPFALSSSGTTSSLNYLTQNSVFGANSAGLFGASPSSTPVSNPSFMFGQPSGSFGSSSVFGYSSHNPFGSSSSGSTAFPSFQTQGSLFHGSSTGVFGAPSSSPSPFPNSMFGQTSGSSGSSSLFGIKCNANCNPVAPHTVGNSTSSGFPSQSSYFSGNSAGIFGRKSSSSWGSPSTFSFGIPSTAAPGVLSSTSDNGFALNPFGSSPAFASQATGSIFAQPSIGFVRATRPMNAFATSSDAAFTPMFFDGLASYAPNAGTNTASYTHTFFKEGASTCKLTSISALPIYGGKSHEELRWEDYELKSRGKNISSDDNSLGSRNIFNNQQPTFSFPSLTSPMASASTSSIFTASTGAVTSSKFTPLPSFIAAPSASTNINTSIFPTPSFPSPSPLQNFSPFGTHASTSNTSESAHSISLQGLDLALQSWLNSSDRSLINPKPITQPNGIWSNDSSSVTPEAESNRSLNTTTTAQVPSTGIIPSQTIPAQAASTTPAFSKECNVGVSVSHDLGQHSPSQSFLSEGKATDNIVAVKDPFGPQTGSSLIHSSCPSIIQQGISSIPVADKPATTRVSSLLSIRHSSIRPLRVHIRKYRPKIDASKVPFFDHIEEAQNTHKKHNFPVPRENPISVFSSSTKVAHVTATKDEASPLNKDEEQKAKPEKSADINLQLPKLERSEYYTNPSIQELATKESLQPGFCSHVKNFMVGRHGYGCIKYEGETDVRGLDLDSLIHFNNREVIVFPDEKEKPPVRQGLNKPAEVTLLNIRCIDRKTGTECNSRKMVDKFTEKLRKVTQEQGAEFISFDVGKGEWKFRVKHF